MSLVTMNVSGIGGTIQTQFSGVINAGTTGFVTVDSRDVVDLLRAGAVYANSQSRYAALSAAPRAGTAGRIVASTSFANGTLSIANQPDVGRVVTLKVDPGTTAITAGNTAITYAANDGTTTVDNINCATALSQILTVSTSKGVLSLTSVIITAVAGGTSPGVQVDDTPNALAVPVDPGFASLAIVRENLDGAKVATVGSVFGTTGCIVPNTAPNGTHTYSWQYNVNSPDI